MFTFLLWACRACGAVQWNKCTFSTNKWRARTHSHYFEVCTHRFAIHFNLCGFVHTHVSRLAAFFWFGVFLHSIRFFLLLKNGCASFQRLINSSSLFFCFNHIPFLLIHHMGKHCMLYPNWLNLVEGQRKYPRQLDERMLIAEQKWKFQNELEWDRFSSDDYQFDSDNFFPALASCLQSTLQCASVPLFCAKCHCPLCRVHVFINFYLSMDAEYQIDVFENKEWSERTHTVRNWFMQSCVWVNVNGAKSHTAHGECVPGKNGFAIKFDMEASDFISKSTWPKSWSEQKYREHQAYS